MTRRDQDQKTSWSKTCSALSRFSPPECTVSAVVGTSVSEHPYKTSQKGKTSQGPVKTIRIRILPPKKQLSRIVKMHDQSRWFYNAARDIVYTNCPDLLKQRKVSETMLRDLIKKFEYSEEIRTPSQDGKFVWVERGFKEREGKAEWPALSNMEVLHNRIPRGAVCMFARSLNSMLSNLRAGNIRKGEMGYRSKKNPIQTTLFEDADFPKEFLTYKSGYHYTTRKNGRNKRAYMSFADIFREDEHQSGFVLEHDTLTNKHYILYTVPLGWHPSDDRNSENQAGARPDDCALGSVDPGVRTFMTVYDPAGKIITIGDGANLELSGMLQHIDQCRVENKSRQIILKLQRKVQNRVKDMHWKAGKYLATHHDCVLYPPLQVSRLVKGKRLNRRTKRQLLALSFYQFEQRLIHQARKYGSRVLLVQEDWTSKTCGSCGRVNSELGGAKVFECPDCGVVLDRDENGARNVLLKQLPILERYASRDSDFSVF